MDTWQTSPSHFGSRLKMSEQSLDYKCVFLLTSWVSLSKLHFSLEWQILNYVTSKLPFCSNMLIMDDLALELDEWQIRLWSLLCLSYRTQSPSFCGSPRQGQGFAPGSCCANLGCMHRIPSPSLRQCRGLLFVLPLLIICVTSGNYFNLSGLHL